MALGVYHTAGEGPLRRGLVDAGAVVALGADDPRLAHLARFFAAEAREGPPGPSACGRP